MTRHAKAILVIVLSALPLQELAFALPHRLEFPFVVAVVCLLEVLRLWVLGRLWEVADMLDGGRDLNHPENLQDGLPGSRPLWSVPESFIGQGKDGAGNQLLVSLLRVAAAKHAQRFGLVTADDLREAASTEGIPLPPSVFPKVFRPPMFREVSRVKSRRPECHGRKIGVYALGAL